FHRERGADTPYAAHRHSENEPYDHEYEKVWSETGDKTGRREKQNIDYKSAFPAVAIGRKAKEQSAKWARRQSERDGHRDPGHIGSKFLRHVLEHKYENEEIEGVERPGEIARDGGVALIGRERVEHGEHDCSSRRVGRWAEGSAKSCHMFGAGSWNPFLTHRGLGGTHRGLGGIVSSISCVS